MLHRFQIFNLFSFYVILIEMVTSLCFIRFYSMLWFPRSPSPHYIYCFHFKFIIVKFLFSHEFFSFIVFLRTNTLFFYYLFQTMHLVVIFTNKYHCWYKGGPKYVCIIYVLTSGSPLVSFFILLWIHLYLLEVLFVH